MRSRLLAMGLLLVGCGDDAALDAGSDGGADAGDVGVSLDAGLDAPPDAPPVECAAAPTPLIAGTTETDALADAPARCGQEAYAWMRDDDRGALVDNTPLTLYPVGLALGVLESFGVEIEPPPHRVATTTITYRTQERGRDVLATALVAAPTTLDPGAEADVLLLLHGTTGFFDGCGASHTLEYGAFAGVFAAYGYVVVLPDYIGLAAEGVETGIPHPFIVGEPTAHASLDAVRAALRLPPSLRADVCARPRVATFGVSQGGHAALWVDRLAPYYARELELVGTVAVVPPGATVAQIERGLAENIPITPLSVGIIAAHAEWYGLTDALDEFFLPPWDADLPELFAGECNVDTGVFPDDVAELFHPDARDAAAAGMLNEFGSFGCTLTAADLILSDVAPRSEETGPVLYITGEADPTVNAPVERTAYETLCGTTFDGQYLECEGAGHVEPLLWALPEILAFIEARFAGEAFSGSCTAGAPQRCLGTPAEM